MGFPENRDIEPTRDDFADFSNQPDFVIMNNDENEQMEVDDDNSLNDGYSRLQTFDNGEEMPADDSDSSESDQEGENEFNFDNIPISSEPPSGIPEIVSSESEIQAEVWNTPRSSDTIELNSEKSQQIQQIMSNFSLPNVPAHIKDVNPRELLERIKNKPHGISSPADKKKND